MKIISLLLGIILSNSLNAQIKIVEVESIEYHTRKQLIHYSDSFANTILVNYLQEYDVRISCAESCEKAWFIAYLTFNDSSKICDAMIVEYKFCGAPLMPSLEIALKKYFSLFTFDPFYANTRIKIRIGRFLKC